MAGRIDYFSEEKLAETYDLQLIKRLLPFIQPYRWLFAASVVLVMLITAIDLTLPLVTQFAIDEYIVPQVTQSKGSPDHQGPDPTKYYPVALDSPAVAAIVARHRRLFIIKEKQALISYAHFEELSADERQALRHKDLRGVLVLAELLLVLVCLDFILNFLQVLTLETLGQSVMHDLRVRVYRHIQSLSMAFFTRNPVGRLVTRTTNDIQNLNEMFTKVFTFLFKDLLLLTGITVTLMVIHWKLALITYTVIPPVVIAAFYFANRARDVFRRLRLKVAEINSRFSEMIQGIRVIQLFKKEAAFFTLFKRLNHENYQDGMEQIHIYAVFMPLIELLGSTSVALVIFFGGRGVIDSQISLGVLVAFISYMRMFFRPIRDITEKYNILQNAMSSAERIFQVLDTQDTIRRETDPLVKAEPVLDQITTIEFRSVSFAYVAEETILKNISFHLSAGRSLAIVGPTGSGKTSLINLVMRFYDPTEGQILINQQDIKSYDPSQLRTQFAIVTQDPFLFSDTILHNVMAGRTEAEEGRIYDILNAAKCNTFVERLPNGVHTVLNEGGGSLSSGERQLLSIARAFAKNPEVIILDEATSYIDTGTEQKIQEALDNLMVGRTSIIIAHRLSTARKAAHILVLDHGQIVEAGSHQELLAQRGVYYKLSLLK